MPIKFILLICIVGTLINSIVGVGADEDDDEMIRPECRMSNTIGVNDLSIIDVVARNPNTGTACIRAIFSLAIKVETVGDTRPTVAGNADDMANGENGHNMNNNNGHNGQSSPNGKSVHDNRRQLIGFLSLDQQVKVEDNCWTPSTTSNNSKNETVNPNDIQVLVIRFECGLLNFHFSRDKSGYFVSKIAGTVNLDPNTSRHFESNQQVFRTKDLDHHFKQSSLIEVVSDVKSKSYVLTANFYNTELEAYRDTTTREFVRPPEEPENEPENKQDDNV